MPPGLRGPVLAEGTLPHRGLHPAVRHGRYPDSHFDRASQRRAVQTVSSRAHYRSSIGLGLPFRLSRFLGFSRFVFRNVRLYLLQLFMVFCNEIRVAALIKFERDRIGLVKPTINQFRRIAVEKRNIESVSKQTLVNNPVVPVRAEG